MTPEKSLQIINEAIEKSRKDFEKNAGSPMIIWGIVVLVFSITIWIMLTLTGNLNWNFLWFGIPVIGFPLTSILLKGKCKEGSESFITGLGCTVALFFSQNEFVPLYFSAASILNLVVPGIMMNKRAK